MHKTVENKTYKQVSLPDKKKITKGFFPKSKPLQIELVIPLAYGTDSVRLWPILGRHIKLDVNEASVYLILQ